eukprot:scaffold52351_cov37-Prasinocladus_malaysianus.AAC.1
MSCIVFWPSLIICAPSRALVEKTAKALVNVLVHNDRSCFQLCGAIILQDLPACGKVNDSHLGMVGVGFVTDVASRAIVMRLEAPMPSFWLFSYKSSLDASASVLRTRGSMARTFHQILFSATPTCQAETPPAPEDQTSGPSHK